MMIMEAAESRPDRKGGDRGHPAYLYGETEPVRVKFQEWTLEIKPRPVESFGRVESPLIRTERE
jgi:hypothetical protein